VVDVDFMVTQDIIDDIFTQLLDFQTNPQIHVFNFFQILVNPKRPKVLC
jgi:hypothetical protein